MTTLTARRGDDFVIRFTWRFNGTPIDMTGYTVECIITINGVSTTYTTTPQITLTPLLGRIDILIEDAVTALWGTSGSWKVRVTSPADLVTTLGDGKLGVR